MSERLPHIALGLFNALMLAANLAFTDGSALNLSAICVSAFCCGVCAAFSIALTRGVA